MIRFRVTQHFALTTESAAGLMGVGVMRFEPDNNGTWSVSSGPVGGWSGYRESSFRLVSSPGFTWGVLVSHWFCVLLTGAFAVVLGPYQYAAESTRLAVGNGVS